MRAEPDVDLAALRDVLRDRYGLAVTGLTFVPRGLDSWSYVADVRDGSRAFVKLMEPSPPDAPRPRGAELPLLTALADRGLRVPRPIPDRDGVLMGRFAGFELVLLEQLDGEHLEDETAWPEPLYAKVATVMAAIHGSTDSIRHLVARTERYELPFVPPLIDAVDRLAAGAAFPAGTQPALAGLRALIAPRAAEIRALSGRLATMRDRARARGGDTVLCHTDLWGSNLLLDANGELGVVDWDGAMIGPPEQDLFMFAGTDFFPAGRFGWFLARYEAALGPLALDADVFAFYIHRRNLEDIAEFVATVTRGGIDDSDLQASVGYAANVIAEWPLLEARVGAIRRVLADRA